MPIDTILMLGKTGSGKNTQAQLLREKIHFPIFSSGDRFREIKKQDTALGNRIREDLDKGYLMPPWLSIFVFQESLFKLKTDEGIIFEGVGRKLPEVEMFHEIATWLPRTYTCVYLVVPDEEVLTRQMNRGREDSNTNEKLKIRLDEYYKYTAEVVDFFRSRGKVIDVDGVGDPKDIHERIMKELISHGILGLESV